MPPPPQAFSRSSWKPAYCSGTVLMNVPTEESWAELCGLEGLAGQSPTKLACGLTEIHALPP